MIYDTSKENELNALNFRFKHLLSKNSIIDLKEVKKTRTTLQNSALHKFFMIISEQLNELGMEYKYFGVKGNEISLMYTPELVKEFFWKQIQVALFDKKSTTKLTTEEMNQIIDIITKFFADKGVLIEFPNREHLK